MPVAAPSQKPMLSQEKLDALLKPFNLDRSLHPIVIVGIRGYYLNSLGEKGKNDRGIYDDALFISSPQIMAAYNANTDPSEFRKGKGTADATKGMARMKAGLHLVHGFGKHKGEYLALTQQKPMTVIRDGNPDYEDTGSFGINIHKGYYNSTSSLGCQTLHPAQWNGFIATMEDQARRFFGTRWNKVIFPYVLIENTGQI